MEWNVFSFFTRKGNYMPTVLTDPTVYRVETTQHVYYGRIVFQDDKQLKLQTMENKAIKILKENIKHIKVVRSDSVDATQESWRQH